MFKIPEFKKHFLTIAIINILALIVAYYSLFLDVVLPIKALIFLGLCFFPLLINFGYFWESIHNIIERRVEHEFTNVYSKNYKQSIIIELPELNLFKLVWRGISGIVASIVVIIPISLLVYNSMTTNNAVNVQQNPMMQTVAIIFYSTFLPALFWNYAKNNSIVSMLNIPKVVYIMGNYTLSYIVKTFAIVALACVNSLIDKFIINQSGILDVFSIWKDNASLYEIFKTPDASFLIILIFLAVLQLKTFYFALVNAYLLGTLVPCEEY